MTSDGGIQGEETEDSQQGEVSIWSNVTSNSPFESSTGCHEYSLLFQTSEAAPIEDSNPPTSPTVNIKEEPVDEGYDAALLPQSSIRQIKEELEHQEVGMKRGLFLCLCSLYQVLIFHYE